MRYWTLLLTLLLVPALALAQAASQPASAPVATPAGVMAFISKWWPLVLLLIVPLAISLKNALTKYTPQATGVITFLNIFIDVISFWGNKDSKTGPTLPGFRSEPPTDGGTPAGGGVP